MLSQAGEQFCLIGGLAVQRWGEPRVTRDWINLEAVLLRQRVTLDWTLVFGELEPLLGLGETTEKLEQLLRHGGD